MTDSTRARGRGMPRSPSTFMHSGNDVRSRNAESLQKPGVYNLGWSLPVDFR
jgi:hypothetical protein